MSLHTVLLQGHCHLLIHDLLGLRLRNLCSLSHPLLIPTIVGLTMAFGAGYIDAGCTLLTAIKAPPLVFDIWTAFVIGARQTWLVPAPLFSCHMFIAPIADFVVLRNLGQGINEMLC